MPHDRGNHADDSNSRGLRLNVTCPTCGGRLGVPLWRIGRSGRCEGCRTKFRPRVTRSEAAKLPDTMQRLLVQCEVCGHEHGMAITSLGRIVNCRGCGEKFRARLTQKQADAVEFGVGLIPVHCPGCSTSYHVKLAKLGKVSRCSRCGRRFQLKIARSSSPKEAERPDEPPPSEPSENRESEREIPGLVTPQPFDAPLEQTASHEGQGPDFLAPDSSSPAPSGPEDGSPHTERDFPREQGPEAPSDQLSDNPPDLAYMAPAASTSDLTGEATSSAPAATEPEPEPAADTGDVTEVEPDPASGDAGVPSGPPRYEASADSPGPSSTADGADHAASLSAEDAWQPVAPQPDALNAAPSSVSDTATDDEPAGAPQAGETGEEPPHPEPSFGERESAGAATPPAEPAGKPAEAPTARAGAATTGDDHEANGKPIDINRAGKRRLRRIPGLGKRVADRIVKHRECSGPFQHPDDLQQIEGINARMAEDLATHVVFHTPTDEDDSEPVDATPPGAANTAAEPDLVAAEPIEPAELDQMSSDPATENDAAHTSPSSVDALSEESMEADASPPETSVAASDHDASGDEAITPSAPEQQTTAPSPNAEPDETAPGQADPTPEPTDTPPEPTDSISEPVISSSEPPHADAPAEAGSKGDAPIVDGAADPEPAQASVRFELHTETTLTNANGPIFEVALDRTGRWALCNGMYPKLELWDLDTGQPINAIELEAVSWTVAISGDATRGLTGHEDGSMHLWDLQHGEPIRVFNSAHAERVQSVRMAEDGRHALSAGDDGLVRLWDLEAGRCLRTLKGHTDRVVAVRYAAAEQRAISVSWDGTLRLWDLSTGACVKTYPIRQARLTCLAVTADGHQAVFGDEHGEITLMDLESEQCFEMGPGHERRVNSVAISADGDWAITGSDDRRVALWDMAHGRTPRFLAAHTGWVSAVNLTPSVDRVVSASWDGTLRLHRIAATEAEEI